MPASTPQTAPTPAVAAIPAFVNDRYHEELRTDYTGLIQRVRSDIDHKGMAVLEQFLHPDFLARLQSSVEELTPRCYAGEKRKPLIGSDLRDTRFWDMTFDEFTIQMANDILAPFHVHLEASDIHPALNILVGDRGQDTVGGWHFDATYLTIAMPVVMPPPSGTGDGKFRIWPNVRKFSQSRFQDRIYSNLAHIGALRKFVKNYAINFIPGNLYFFYGFRSYHGTDSLDSAQCRANCLINFGGPLFDLGNGKIIRYGR